jgi:hypothetical protein
MVKFRALLGESSLHKKGTCSVSLRVPSKHRENGTKQMTPIYQKVFKPPMQIGENASGNLKKHEKICLGPKKLSVCQYCAKQFKFNYLGIRHEKKGCRDRPG